MKKLLLGIVFLSLVGCKEIFLPSSTFPVDRVEILSPHPTSWNDYGAYYTTQKVVIETTPISHRNFPLGGTRFTDIRELYIFSESGLKGATMQVPFLGDTLISAEFAIIYSDDSIVKLNSSELIAEYSKSGVVVFPTTPVNCRLTSKIIFEKREHLTSYEKWIKSDYPVVCGEVLLVSPKDVPMKCKSFGKETFFATSVDTLENWLVRGWKYSNFKPYTQSAYQPFSDELYPRIIFSSYAGWNNLIDALSTLLGGPLSNEEERALDKVLGNLVTLSEQSIYQWVRDSVSTVNSAMEKRDLARLVSSRQGNPWEVTLLLNHLYTKANIPSRIIMTRGKNLGGFEKNMILPEMLMDPLVIVGKPPKIAYPFIANFPLGVYPIGYWGLEGVTFDSAKVVFLPPTTMASSKINAVIRIELDAQNQTTIQQNFYSGYHGAVLRSQLTSMQKERQDYLVQLLMANQHRENKVSDVHISSLDDENEFLGITLKVANQGQHYRRENKEVMKLGHLFDTYFSDFDIQRSIPFVVSIEREISEEVSFVVSPEIRVDTFVVDSVHISNPLFDYDVTVSKDSILTICRKIKIKACRLQPEELKPILKDVLKMREIQSWYIGYSEVKKY